MQKKKILIVTMSEGHKSIALTIADYLKDDYEIMVTPDNLFAKYEKVYRLSYQYFPYLLNVPSYLSKSQTISTYINTQIKNHILPYVKDVLTDFKPDLIISTYFGFNLALHQVVEDRIPVINIVTDPRTPYALIFDPKGTNCLFDQKLYDDFHDQFPDLKYRLTGWFTNQKYFASHQNSRLYKEFKFDPKLFTILLCGGSEGMSEILKIFPALLLSTTPVQMITICGHNRRLYSFLNQAVKLHQDLPNKLKRPLHVKVIGYTKQMSQLMAMSDLVVGKAGPNLLFEAVASGKPFFAISHLPGQEEGNIDLIKDENLGYVEENPYKASKLLMDIIKNPQQLDGFKAPIAQMRNYNQQAPEKLKQLIKEML